MSPPAGRSVRVKFWWEAKHKVPANAKAVIASPSIVADRYLQLTPAYSKGDVMADGAEIPLTGPPYRWSWTRSTRA